MTSSHELWSNDHRIDKYSRSQEQALVAAGTDVDAPIEDAEHKQLAFSFAKRHKVLLETAETPALLYHTNETDFTIFAEVRRF